VTLAEAQAALAAIDSAIARSERTVQFSDRAVTYRSMDELMTARQFYAGQVALIGGRPKQSLGVATKGFI
jgi:hypothetical protein